MQKHKEATARGRSKVLMGVTGYERKKMKSDETGSAGESHDDFVGLPIEHVERKRKKKAVDSIDREGLNNNFLTSFLSYWAIFGVSYYILWFGLYT